jgi:small neutral amino acid transporter SnatA (MarC family)
MNDRAIDVMPAHLTDGLFMNKSNFPFIALAIGMFLMGVLYITGAINPDAELVLPLLTVLIISEFGFIVMAAAVFLGIQTMARNGFDIVLSVVTLLCGMLGVEFMITGLEHWPGTL